VPGSCVMVDFDQTVSAGAIVLRPVAWLSCQAKLTLSPVAVLHERKVIVPSGATSLAILAAGLSMSVLMMSLVFIEYGPGLL